MLQQSTIRLRCAEWLRPVCCHSLLQSLSVIGPLHWECRQYDETEQAQRRDNSIAMQDKYFAHNGIRAKLALATSCGTRCSRDHLSSPPIKHFVNAHQCWTSGKYGSERDMPSRFFDRVKLSPEIYKRRMNPFLHAPINAFCKCNISDGHAPILGLREVALLIVT